MKCQFMLISMKFFLMRRNKRKKYSLRKNASGSKSNIGQNTMILIL